LLQPRIAALKVLVVDDDHYMRKVVRTMLIAIGVKAATRRPTALLALMRSGSTTPISSLSIGKCR